MSGTFMDGRKERRKGGQEQRKGGRGKEGKEREERRKEGRKEGRKRWADSLKKTEPKMN